MAIFNITSTSTTQPGDHAFDLDSPQADTLNVLSGVSLTAAGEGSRGALLGRNGAWTVNLEGTIVAENSVGIDLAAGNTAVSTINIRRGTVMGEEAAIAVRSSANIENSGRVVGTVNGIVIENGGLHTVVNSGVIRGGDFSIVDRTGLSDDRVANSGTLDGAISLGGGTNWLLNSGTIDGAVSGGNSSDLFSNAGTILGHVSLGNGTNTLTNENRFALIQGDVVGGSGNDTITNSAGTITGTVFLGDGTNRLANSGTIRGDEGAFNPNLNSVFGGSGDDTVLNSGTIREGVDLGGGQNTLSNSGTIDGSVSFAAFGGGNDTITNSGLISGGVLLGDGADTLNNSGTITGVVLGGDGVDTVTNTGSILDVINLGNGNDIFNGGNGIETVRDFNGADMVTLGGGGDTYIATYNNAANTGTDGIDTIDAGGDSDTYDASGATSTVVINLGSIPGELLANTATGVDVAGTLRDSITGFENAKGGSGKDSLFGTNDRNALDGGAQNDFLFGFGEADTLNGGLGNDIIVGGLGRDVLTGDGLAPGSITFADIADTFRYFSADDSGATSDTRDVITDFQFWRDKIDLQFDANTNTATNDEFDWIGTDAAFTAHAGELRARSVADGLIVEADLNGDAAADFSIKLLGTDITLTADLFGL